MQYFLLPDKTYREADLLEWSQQYEEMYNAGTRHVGNDQICGKRISTVWLGLDHNFIDGEPLVFETMVFDSLHSGKDIYMERYTTWDEALAGHHKAIEWVKEHYDNNTK